MSKEVSITMDKPVKATRRWKNGEMVDKGDRTPTLIQNRANQYTYVPRELADELVKDNRAIIMTPGDEDYVEGVKKALGIWEGFKAHEMIQVNGKIIRAEEISKLDTKAMIAEAEEDVKEFKVEKDSGLIKVDKLPQNMVTFQGKFRDRRWGRG